MTSMKSCFSIAALVTTVCTCALTGIPRREPIDLSSPETTVISFTKAAARGDVESALACCRPGSYDYDDIKEALTATSSSPAYAFKQMFDSIETRVPIRIASVDKNGGTADVVWRVTFKRGFTVMEGGGRTSNAGSSFDLDGTLKKSGDRWLIEGI